MSESYSMDFSNLNTKTRTKTRSFKRERTLSNLGIETEMKKIRTVTANFSKSQSVSVIK